MAAPRPLLRKVFQLRCRVIYAVCLWGVPWRSFSSLAPESRQPPIWWQEGWARQRAGSVAEAELLAPLGELLMPGVPVTEMFRSFKSPAAWGGHYLEPDLTAYGVLKDKTAALFVEYDGYWRHGTKEGMANDHMKNAALLGFAPPGSYVVRISHENECQLEENVLWVTVNPWRPGDHKSFTRTLENVLKEVVPRLQHALNPGVCKRFQAHLSDKRLFVISRSAKKYRESAFVQRGGNTTEEIQNFLSAEGFGQADIDRLHKQALICGPSIETTLQPLLQLLSRSGLTQGQVAKAVATSPQIFGLSIQQNLKPTVQWFLDLGLTKSQFAKVVATFPEVLGYSIEKNLKPTVQWFLDLGLTESQVVRAVATHPQVLGLSIEQNLKPTVKWFLNFGLTKSQIAKAVAAFPAFLWLSLEDNLNPTVQWFLDLGLTKSQVAKAVATHPQILGLSIEQNLQPTVQWFLDLGLTEIQVAGAVAARPQILGYSIEQNLQPTVQWFLDLGLTESQVVRAVATHPQVLGLSIEQNLKPTVKWFLNFGLTKSQIAKAVAAFPAFLWLSLEDNLNPSVQWFLELGLTQSQVAMAVATFPQILCLRIDNLACKVKLLRAYLAPRGAVELIAHWPRILSYSQKRMEDRLHILSETGNLGRLMGAMTLTEDAFHKRFVAPQQKDAFCVLAPGLGALIESTPLHSLARCLDDSPLLTFRIN